MEVLAEAIAVGNGARDDLALAEATAALPPDADPHLRFRLAYMRAARFAYAGDFEHAAAAFVAVIPELAKHPDSADEFWAHNAMMMIREAQGDPAAALAENDQATIAATRGSWDADNRDTLAYLKDRWHRAYLTRMLAESRKGSVKQGLVQYAESALDDYRRRARALGSNDESIAVLEAYFAALDGRRQAAKEAAAKVDPAKDDDIEDLYLVVVGLAAGGDSAKAEEGPAGSCASRAACISRVRSCSAGWSTTAGRGETASSRHGTRPDQNNPPKRVDELFALVHVVMPSG